MTRSHLFCFYAWHASILMYKVTPKYLGFKYSSTLESCWLPFFHTRKGFYVSVTHVHGAKLRHLTFDLWTGLWISSSMEALSHCSPERTNLKSHLKISQESFFSPTFSSSTSTSSRLFAIMLIRSAKLSLSMHSPRCFTTNQSGKVSLWKELHHNPCK